MFNFKEQDIISDSLAQDKGYISYYQIEKIWLLDGITKFTANEIFIKHNGIITVYSGRASRLFCESNIHNFKRFSLPSIEDMAILNKFLTFA